MPTEKSEGPHETRAASGQAGAGGRDAAASARSQHTDSIAAISHELKNALNLISVNADVLARLLGPLQSPRVLAALDMIRQGVRDQSRIIGGLADLGPRARSATRPAGDAEMGTVTLRATGAGRPGAARSGLALARTVRDDPSARPWRGLKVLLADDAVEASQALAELLEMDGATVDVAHDGAEALAEFQKESFDIVVADLGMPNMDGYELAMRLRALSAGKDIPLVAMTGFTRPSDVQSALKAGFDAHVGKPVSIAALAATLGGLRERTTAVAGAGSRQG